MCINSFEVEKTGSQKIVREDLEIYATVHVPVIATEMVSIMYVCICRRLGTSHSINVDCTLYY